MGVSFGRGPRQYEIVFWESFAKPLGAVAQLGERQLCKLEVVSSNLIGSISQVFARTNLAFSRERRGFVVFWDNETQESPSFHTSEELLVAH